MFFLSLLFVLALVLFLLIFFASSRRVADFVADKEVFTILILYEQNGELAFSELYSINAKTQRAFLLDLPAQTGYEQTQRVSWLGKLYEEQSPQEFKELLSRFIGIPIDFYWRFDEEAMMKTVDLLGGIPVYIEENLYEMELKREGPVGNVVLDGDQTITYLDQYHQREFDSARHNFFYAFISTFAEQQALVLQKEALHFLYKTIDSDLNSSYFLDFLLKNFFFRQYKLFLFLKVRGQSQSMVDGNKTLDVVFPFTIGRSHSLARLVDKGMKQISSESSDLASIYIEVLNGTQRSRLAQKTSEFLVELGYQVERIGNTPQDSEESLVLGYEEDLIEARIVAEELQINRVELNTQSKNEDLVNVTVILGSDFDEQLFIRQ